MSVDPFSMLGLQPPTGSAAMAELRSVVLCSMGALAANADAVLLLTAIKSPTGQFSGPVGSGDPLNTVRVAACDAISTPPARRLEPLHSDTAATDGASDDQRQLVSSPTDGELQFTVYLPALIAPGTAAATVAALRSQADSIVAALTQPAVQLRDVLTGFVSLYATAAQLPHDTAVAVSINSVQAYVPGSSVTTPTGTDGTTSGSGGVGSTTGFASPTMLGVIVGACIGGVALFLAVPFACRRLRSRRIARITRNPIASFGDPVPGLASKSSRWPGGQRVLYSMGLVGNDISDATRAAAGLSSDGDDTGITFRPNLVSRSSRVQVAGATSASNMADSVADAIAVLQDAALQSVIHARPLRSPSAKSTINVQSKSGKSVLGLTAESVSRYSSRAPKVRSGTVVATQK